MVTRTKTKADVTEEVTAALSKIVKSAKRSMRTEMEAVGLTVPQAMTLHAVAGAGGRLSARDIGRECDMLASTTTGVIDRLEQHGYVQRERDESDRRVVWINLTPEGERVQSQLGGFFSQFGRTFSILPMRDLEQLSDILGRVAAAIEKEGR
jgi:MarR family transcriptional regulator, organic hydroperoxide resistance regulator